MKWVVNLRIGLTKTQKTFWTTKPIRRGEIWLYNANPTLGDEISKIRPAIIVNNDEIGTLRLKVIVPITGWNPAFIDVPWMVRLNVSPENQLTKTSSADTFQIRSVAQQRLIRQLGLVDRGTMQLISQALAIVLNINE